MTWLGKVLETLSTTATCFWPCLNWQGGDPMDSSYNSPAFSPLPLLPFPTTCNFKQWWWIMKFLKQIPAPVCWRCSQCCQQAAVWSLAAFIEKQARMQWQINVVGKEAVDFWQWGLWKPFVSWAEEIKSKKALSVLNLRWLVPKASWKALTARDLCSCGQARGTRSVSEREVFMIIFSKGLGSFS